MGTNQTTKLVNNFVAKETNNNEIRTLTLRFANRATAVRFAAFCERHGHKAAVFYDGTWYTVTAIFQNKAARSKLVRAWAKESMVVSE
jgi:hypothetical protein